MTRIHRSLLAASLSAASLIAASLMSSAAHAQTYDAFAQFSLTQNDASRTWQYGFAANLGGFTRFDQTFNNGSGTGWKSSTINDPFSTPSVRNGGTQLLTHPGPGGGLGDLCIIRFVAPAADTYAVSAQFLAGDSGNTDAYVLQNALSGSPVFSVASTDASPTYTGSLALAAGDTLDFVVGTGNGDYSGDTTPVAITITGSAATVPEAGAGLLMGGGTFALVGRLLVRRARKAA